MRKWDAQVSAVTITCTRAQASQTKTNVRIIHCSSVLHSNSKMKQCWSNMNQDSVHSVLFLASNVFLNLISGCFYALNWESSWPPGRHFVSCYDMQTHVSHIKLSNHAVQNANQASVAAYFLASNGFRTIFRRTVWLQNVNVLAPHGCHFVFCFATALSKLRSNCQTRQR